MNFTEALILNNSTISVGIEKVYELKSYQQNNVSLPRSINKNIFVRYHLIFGEGYISMYRDFYNGKSSMIHCIGMNNTINNKFQSLELSGVHSSKNSYYTLTNNILSFISTDATKSWNLTINTKSINIDGIYLCNDLIPYMDLRFYLKFDHTLGEIKDNLNINTQTKNQSLIFNPTVRSNDSWILSAIYYSFNVKAKLIPDSNGKCKHTDKCKCFDNNMHHVESKTRTVDEILKKYSHSKYSSI